MASRVDQEMVRKFNPDTIYPPTGLFYNAVEVEAGERLIFSSGLIGMTQDGDLPTDPAKQIDQAWRNVASFLEGASLRTDNLVRLKMHLTSRDYLPLSKAARIRHLGEPMHCAVTGLIVDLFDPDLVIEIDVCAAR